MNKQKILAAGLACTSFVPSIQAFAANSEAAVEYQTASENGSQSTSVNAEIGEEFAVTIPKLIVLSGKDKTASYKVTVSGDIAGESSVNVVPDDGFTLYEESGNKDDVDATISQDKTKWSVIAGDSTSDDDKLKVDHIEYTEATGTISAPGLTAGAWSGEFNFNINLNTVLGTTNDAEEEHVHSYTTTYSWTSDYSSCTATAVCECGDTVTETVDSTTSTVSEATTESGSVTRYSATFSNSEFTVQTKDIENDDKVVAAEGYTLSWTSPLAYSGSGMNYAGTISSYTATGVYKTGYIGEGDVATKASSQGSGAQGVYYGNKRIVYTDVNGNTAYANPYEAGSITIKKDTEVILQMYAGSSSSLDSYVGLCVGGSNVGFNDDCAGTLISYVCAPSGSGTLSCYYDYYYSSLNNYYWSVNVAY